MQDYHVTYYEHFQKQEISRRTQNLLVSLKDVWERLQELSHENVQNILDMVACFPEPYIAPVLHGIAEKLISNMVVHYLDILATFYQKAGQEDFDAQEQIATLAESMADLLPMITGLSRRLVVRTLDDVATLAAITVGLYGLSHVESAEQAQHWLYVLPQQYVEQLAQEHLLTAPPFQFSLTVHMATAPSMAELPRMHAAIVDAKTQLASFYTQLDVPSVSDGSQQIDSTTTEPPTPIAA